MMTLLLSMPAFAQDYATWDDATWTAKVEEADAALDVELQAFDAWLTQVGNLQQQVITADENGTMGQAEKDACVAGLDTVEQRYSGLLAWAETYADPMTWPSDNPGSVPDETTEAALTTLVTYVAVAPMLTESELFLAEACMLAGVSSGDQEMSAQYARYGMQAAESAVEMGMQADETIMSSVLIADGFGLSERDEWVRFGEQSCQTQECKDLMEEYAGSGGDSGGGGLNTTLAVRWQRPETLHQLGAGLAVQTNNVRVEGEVLYGLREQSRGWSVKGGFNKQVGGRWGGSLGVLGVLDQYGVNDSGPTYALDRTWGLEVPMTLSIGVGSQASVFGGLALRWNLEQSRQSAGLPSWIHEMQTEGGVRYYTDLATLQASWFWWATGPGTLTGPRVSLLF